MAATDVYECECRAPRRVPARWISRHHPPFLLAGEITLFVSGLQNAPVLHNDTESSREAQGPQELLCFFRKQLSLLDLAPELGEQFFRNGWFRFLHGSFTSARTAEPDITCRLWHRGIESVNEIIALGILLKYMYSF